MHSYGEKNILNDQAIKIRQASQEDSANIFRWRNDSLTRLMSRNVDIIAAEIHDKWYHKLLQNPNSLLLIGDLRDEAIGMVRFDKLANTENWEVNIAVAPEYRANGLGKELLSRAIATFTAQFPCAQVIAEIKKANLASQKLFCSLKFKHTATEGEMLHFWLSNTNGTN